MKSKKKPIMHVGSSFLIASVLASSAFASEEGVYSPSNEMITEWVNGINETSEQLYAIKPEYHPGIAFVQNESSASDNYSNRFRNVNNKPRLVHKRGLADRGYSASARRQHSVMKQERRLSSMA